jgi:hypothetical protein
VGGTGAWHLPELPTGIDCYFTHATLVVAVTACESTEGEEGASITSSAYRITVDEGRDSFFALCIEDPSQETAWLMSDTVRSLAESR